MKKSIGRIVSFALCLVMIAGLLPATAFAADTETINLDTDMQVTAVTGTQTNYTYIFTAPTSAYYTVYAIDQLDYQYLAFFVNDEVYTENDPCHFYAQAGEQCQILVATYGNASVDEVMTFRLTTSVPPVSIAAAKSEYVTFSNVVVGLTVEPYYARTEGTWTLSNPDVAEISDDYYGPLEKLLEMKQAGTTTVTYTDTTGLKASCSVVFKTMDAVSTDNAVAYTLAAGDKNGYVFTAPEDGIYWFDRAAEDANNLRMQVEGKMYNAVSGSGSSGFGTESSAKVVGLYAGCEYDIVLTNMDTEAVSGTFTVRKAVPATSLEIQERDNSVTLEPDGSFYVMALFGKEYVIPEEVTWTSSNPEVVCVDVNDTFNEGYQFGSLCMFSTLAEGTAVLTATSASGLTDSVIITVGSDEPEILYSGTCGDLACWEIDSNKTLTIFGQGAIDDFSSYTEVPYYQYSFERIVIKPGITRIGKNAFRYQGRDTCIQEVIIPSSVTIIGQGAFTNCIALQQITIPAGVTTIEAEAFYFSGLTEVTIPDSVTEIGYAAFSDCSSLKKVTFGSGLQNLGSYAFLHVNTVEEVYFPDLEAWLNIATRECDDWPFGDSEDVKVYVGGEQVTEVVIPEGITTVYPGVFAHIAGLTRVEIPASVTSIGKEIFYGSGELETIVFHGDAPQIDELAFNGLYNGTTVYYPANNATWTEEIRQDYYGNNITWVPIGGSAEPETPAVKNGWVQEDGAWYYYEEGTKLVSQWLKSGGAWYYLDSSGLMSTGWAQIDGKWYYFSESGAMQTGWLKSGGVWYYLGSEMKTGWAQIDGKWYYFSESGAMQTGWLKSGGVWYYLGSEMKTGWQKIDSKWYYFSANGAMQTGWLSSGGVWYYLDSEMKTGWAKADGKWYYFNSNGAMQTGWQKIDGNWYYLGSEMKTGWLKSGDYWYYLHTNGIMAADQWVGSGSKWYFVDGSGKMLTSQWLTRGDKTYYLDANGVMVTGEYEIDGVVYVFNANGACEGTVGAKNFTEGTWVWIHEVTENDDVSDVFEYTLIRAEFSGEQYDEEWGTFYTFQYSCWTPTTSNEWASASEEDKAMCELWEYNGQTYYCAPYLRFGEDAPISESGDDYAIIVNEMWVPNPTMVLERAGDQEFRITEVSGQWHVGFAVGDSFIYWGE